MNLKKKHFSLMEEIAYTLLGVCLTLALHNYAQILKKRMFRVSAESRCRLFLSCAERLCRYQYFKVPS